MKKISKYRSNGIRVVKFNIGKNNYDKTMIYYKNGKPKMERNYKNGNLDGNLISYWENGIVHTRGQYKENRRIGVWNTFDKKGKWFFPNSIKKNKFYISLIVYKHHTCITSLVIIL